ncbi:MAG: phage tail tape measure protein [Bradymonadaceae bacterium]
MGLDIDGLQKAKRKAAGSLRDLEGVADKAAVGVKAAGAATAAAVGVGAAAAAKLGQESAKAFAEFEAGVEDAGAKAQATEAEIEKMGAAAIKAGQESLHGASEAADAMGLLAQAGLDANQQIEALPGTLQLATAGELDLANAADIATDTMSGLGLEVSELGRVNDVLVKTANSANTSVQQLGQGVAEAAPLAASANIEIEQLSAVLGKLASAGIKGAKGGTAVKGALAKLSKPSNEAQKALNRVGITAEEIQPILAEEGLTGVIERIGQKSENVGRTMTTVFGAEAGPRLQALVQQGTDSVRELRKELDNAGGTAKKVAQTKIETLSGQLQIMRGSVDTAKVALGKELKPVVSAVADEITQLSNDVTEMAQKSDGAAKSTRELAEASRQLTRSSGKLGMTLGTTVVPALAKSAAGTADFWDTTIKATGELVGLTEVSEETARGTRRLANEMGPLQSALNAAGIFSERYSGSLKLLGEGTDRQAKLQEKLSEAIEKHGRDAQKTQKIAQKLRKELQRQGKTITKVATDYDGLGDAVATATKEMLGQEVVTSLGKGYDYVSKKVDTAKKLIGKVGEKLTESGNKANKTKSNISDLKDETSNAADQAERFMRAFEGRTNVQESERLQSQGIMFQSSGTRRPAGQAKVMRDVAKNGLPTPDGPGRAKRGKHTGLVESDKGGVELQATEEQKAKHAKKKREKAASAAKTLTSDIGGLASAMAEAGGASKEATQGITAASSALQDVIGGFMAGGPLGIASGLIKGATSLIGGISGSGGSPQPKDEASEEQKRKKRDKQLAQWIGESVAEHTERPEETIIVADNPGRRSSSPVREMSAQEIRELGRKLKSEANLNPGGV